MCPDKALLSAWYDGEVEEPWHEEIAGHVRFCHKCRAVIEEFENVSRLFDGGEYKDTCDRESEIYRQIMGQHRREKIVPFWRKRVPMPAAAAALVILGLSLIMPRFGSVSTQSEPVFAQLDEQDGEADLSAMESLEPIMLPGDLNFSYYGDSQLLKAAGFEGGLH